MEVPKEQCLGKAKGFRSREEQLLGILLLLIKLCSGQCHEFIPNKHRRPEVGSQKSEDRGQKPVKPTALTSGFCPLTSDL